MVKATLALPRRFAFLRNLFYVTIALFALSLLYIVPLQLTARADTPVSESEFAKWTFLVSGVAILTGMVLCVISLVTLVVAQLVHSRQQPAREFPWKQLRWPALLATLGAVVVFLDVLLGPSVQSELLPVVNGLGMCAYHYQVVAFVDQDGNGLRDPNEVGLPNVHITVSYPDPSPSQASTPTNVSASDVTNKDGLAAISFAYNPCPTTAVSYGHATIHVDTPAGYTPTTLTTFGPMSLPVAVNRTVRLTEYAGFTQAK